MYGLATETRLLYPLHRAVLTLDWNNTVKPHHQRWQTLLSISSAPQTSNFSTSVVATLLDSWQFYTARSELYGWIDKAGHKWLWVGIAIAAAVLVVVFCHLSAKKKNSFRQEQSKYTEQNA
ncbi:hypothetical protein L3X38_022732 [Prunus dulcis]|uniref:Uncharacterized protein n=1 Tax=Prunus dulcis TaxID=3755 RepID=A0AAD4Z5G7_PRUDU|nr:hypothetical protein L3X38_022732 [Prunus dulcis]